MSRKTMLLVLSLLLVSGLTLAACETPEEEPEMAEEPTAEMVEPTEEPAPTDVPPTEAVVMMDDIVTIAQADGRFTTLVDLIGQAGLAETLQGEGPFTVFAPTDEAFEALGEEALADLTAEEIADILTAHVVADQIMAEAITGAEMLPLEVQTLNEAVMLEVNVEDGSVVINGMATVIEADIEAGNGVIHVIDTVLVPEAEEEMAEE